MAYRKKSKSSHQLVKEAIAEIKKLKAEADEKQREAQDFKIKVGRYILDKFFGNNIELARSKDSKKPESYRKLCESKEVGLHKSWLNEAVRLAIREDELEGDAAYSQLSRSLKTLLLREKDLAKVRELAKQAADDDLSARALNDLMAQGAPAKKNLPPTPQRMMARFRRVEGLLTADEITAGFPCDQLENLKEQDREDLRVEAEEMVGQLQQATDKAVAELRKLVEELTPKVSTKATPKKGPAKDSRTKRPQKTASKKRSSGAAQKTA